jgi:peptidoglycan/xylan/chitin deacetylase (PgdA/CDA1 family)
MPIALLYHDVVEPGRDDASGFSGPGAARYKLTRAEFAEHLEALAGACTVPSLPLNTGEEGLRARLLDPSSWLLTFDDGGVSALEPTADLLEKRGWRGVFFVTTGRVGTSTFLSAEQVRELSHRGHVIGSHSHSHPERMSWCSREQMLDEWRRSRDELEEILGAPVCTGSVPGGYYSRVVAETAAAAGYALLFNSEPTTGVVSVDGCQVVGRYTVYRCTSPRATARLLTGRLARWRQALSWNVKKVAKALGGRAYLALRRGLLARKYPQEADAERLKAGRA